MRITIKVNHILVVINQIEIVIPLKGYSKVVITIILDISLKQ